MAQSRINSRKRAWVACGLAVGLGAFALFNNLPHTNYAAPADTYVLYGIQSDTGQLHRYDLDSGTLSTIGNVQDGSGNTLTGIEASAYFPGFTNAFAFWHDPADQLTKLTYVNLTSGKATVIGGDLGPEKISGATGVVSGNGSAYAVYALQDTDEVSFNIDNTTTGTNTGPVVPGDPTAARVAVLGAAISYGGQYDIPVTVRAHTGAVNTDPFGDANLPVNGDVNDANNPRSYIFPSDFPIGTQISVTATAWIKTDSALDGTQNSHWTPYRTVDSGNTTHNVITLRNGDVIPNIPGFLNQAAVPTYLKDFVDPATNTIVLGASQAIKLFELGSEVTVDPYTQTASLTASQDFQDLVLLVTMAQEQTELVTGMVVTGTVSGGVNINPNNSPHGIFELTKPDMTTITMDDLKNATSANVNVNGLYYSGGATKIRIKPKGNGAQNTLLLNGQPYFMKNNTTYTFNAASMTATVYNDQVISTLETVRDEFNAVSYSNNDGTQNWTSDWGSDTGASGGTRRVENGRLHIDNQDDDDDDDEIMARSADLSGAATATYSFDYVGYGDGGTDTVAIEASDDGGTSWTLLETFNIVGAVTGSKTYQLESYISLTANVVVRYRLVSGFAASGQYIEYDNVQIEYNAVTGNPPMGHWWIDISTTGGLTEGDPSDDPTVVSQLILVDQKNGVYQPIMQLSRPYDGLASTDGQVFYATSGKAVYQIDTINETETLLYDHTSGDYSSLGFAGTSLFGFDTDIDHVMPLDPSTGATQGSSINIGVPDLGTIILTPSSKDPARRAFD